MKTDRKPLAEQTESKPQTEETKDTLMDEIGEMNVEMNSHNEQIAFHSNEVESHRGKLDALKVVREQKFKTLRKLMGETF